MLFNEDQTVRSLEKSSHSGKNVCCVVPGTSSLIVHDFFSIHLVRHTGFLQKSILSAWSSTSISCAEHKASNKAETNLVSWGRPHLHQSLPFTIRQIRYRRLNVDFICGYGIKILLLDLMASVLWIFFVEYVCTRSWWSPSPCSSQNLPTKIANKVGTILVIMHRCNRK